MVIGKIKPTAQACPSIVLLGILNTWLKVFNPVVMLASAFVCAKASFAFKSAFVADVLAAVALFKAVFDVIMFVAIKPVLVRINAS